MTDLLSRPILRVPSAGPPESRPVALLAALGAASVALGGLLLCVAVSAAGWFAADTGTFGQAVGIGALGWLVSNGCGLAGGGIAVGAVPLGLLALCALGLYRAGRWAAATTQARSPVDIALATLAMVGAYGVIGTVTVLLVHVDGVHAPPVRSVVAVALLAAVFGGLGLLVGSGQTGLLLEKLPEEARAALVGGLSGVLGMLAISAVVFVASLVAHFSTALTLAEGMHSGLVGGLILALIGAALVPNGVLFAGAFVAGPGFALGTGTAVSPSGVRLGLLPDFPLLAAVPDSAAARWLPALILLPVVAGGVAGLVAMRRYPVFGFDHAALRGALAGLAGGVGFGLLTALATGAIGPGRLQHIGPDVLATTAVCAVAFLLGGAVAAVGRRWLGGFFVDRPRHTGMIRLAMRQRLTFWRRPAQPDAESLVAHDVEPTVDAEVTQPIPRPTDAGATPAVDAELTQPIPRASDGELTQPIQRVTDAD